MMVGYLNRPMLLKYIKCCCLTTVGFDEAFARVSTEDLGALYYMIEEHTSIYTSRYEEHLDFLDGNGFSVEKLESDLYILKYLYGEKPQ